jgi:hypothetical protein
MVAPGVGGELGVGYTSTFTATELTGKPTTDERVINWADRRVSLGSQDCSAG